MSNKLPKAVQAQVDRANALADTKAAKPAGDEPATDAPALAAQSETPPAVQPAQEATAPAPAAPVTDPAAAPPAENWEHKYRVLQGMFKAEVARQVNSAVANSSAQVEQLRNEIAALKAAPPAAPTQDPQKSYKFLSSEEEEDFGADLLDAAARKAKEQYLPIIEQLQSKIGNLESLLQQGTQRVDTVEKVAVQTARDRFFSTLDEVIPTWEQTNIDQGFLSWLDSVDDLTGYVRRDIFNKAYGALDASRVAKFFKAYEQSKGMVPPAATAEAGSAPAQPSTLKPTVPLEQLQAPGKPRTAPVPPAKKTISRQDIAAFYNRQRQGFYRGREAEAAQFEQEIFAAQVEGRVT